MVPVRHFLVDGLSVRFRSLMDVQDFQVLNSVGAGRITEHPDCQAVCLLFFCLFRTIAGPPPVEKWYQNTNPTLNREAKLKLAPIGFCPGGRPWSGTIGSEYEGVEKRQGSTSTDGTVTRRRRAYFAVAFVLAVAATFSFVEAPAPVAAQPSPPPPPSPLTKAEKESQSSSPPPSIIEEGGCSCPLKAISLKVLCQVVRILPSTNKQT
eukprot:CAMPEP_0197468298 /NCGR_PEP_ID=MMETSP1175-20131217/66011_1 /TAXON_ID=1003142 /ORGANISM="Triceratium dubium, Strain CCMP147" /LENGTH=207 /DNA_ID=CAMNT_0043004395 /DNA_START=438 /DNA_END=1061 /DNA_ORIENTATION=-